MICRCGPSQAALSGWDGSRVLHWQNFVPGAFGGYVSNADNIFFDSKVYLPLTYYQGWYAAERGLLWCHPVHACSRGQPMFRCYGLASSLNESYMSTTSCQSAAM
jgi:hypothetical protein